MVKFAIRPALAREPDSPQAFKYRIKLPDTKRAEAKASEREVEQAVRAAEADAQGIDTQVSQSPAQRDTSPVITTKTTRLVGEDFTFDESQEHAINSLVKEQYGCMTGAAGTGKTTCTKAIIDRLAHQLNSVDLSTVWTTNGNGNSGEEDSAPPPAQYVPSVALCAFTGRASQQIKKNFPEGWHGNIMTIHRMLAYKPVIEDVEDPVNGGTIEKRVFRPSYHQYRKLPWDVIIIDEAGMVSTELWHRIWDACRPETRIIMIGDINQLPPVHGRSIFGFAMSRWPSFELTHIHRQKGESNPIVDNAWRILKGQRPQSEGGFQLFNKKPDAKGKVFPGLTGDANKDAAKVIQVVLTLWKQGKFNPLTDAIITATNGYEGQRGQRLGQLPLNNILAEHFNPQPPENRFIIDAGREQKIFAVGDKVMATKNDHEIGITNGMTGVIVEITENGQYQRNRAKFGSIKEINDRIEGAIEDDSEGLHLDNFLSQVEQMSFEKPSEEEEGLRGPSSHTVIVRFDIGGQPVDVTFSTLAEIGSLMIAYVITCHKSQGGEYPFVIVIAHEAHKRMLYREWLYTAVTRASERCLVMHTNMGLSYALSNQKIKGSTLKAKIAAFNKLTEDHKGLGPMMSIELPDPRVFNGQYKEYKQY